jgi:hypothetical protein
MTFDEVVGLQAPATQVAEEWPEEADGQRGQPEQRPEWAVDEPGSEDQRGAGEGERSDPQDRG